jgi:5-methylcytosine-specific restriction endonuclease McrA
MPFPSGETQICSICEAILPLERFSRNGRKDGYRRPECRSCQHNRSKEINPNYQNTFGSVAARERRELSRADVDYFKVLKFRSQEGICVYCMAKMTIQNCHLDHKMPLARGGSDDPSNLQVLCARCNREKHSKSHEEYLFWLRQVGVDREKNRPNS